MLMRDVGPCLVPPGDTPVPQAQHEAFLAHMAELSATFWGWSDDIGLTTLTQRLRFFAPDNIAGELTTADVPGPIAAAAAGWRRLPARSALLWDIARLVHERPEVIADPLAGTPATFLQGDWKMGNLGSHPDGRTILLDWAYPGSRPAGTCAGTWPSTVPGCPNRRKPRSAGSGPRWRPAASAPHPGGSASLTCA